MGTFVLILHLAFIAYMVVGFPVGLITNNRTFRLWHAGCLMFVTILMILGIPCPLTILEEWLTDSSYEGSFLATWLNRIIYLEGFNPQKVFIIDLIFAGLVGSSFIWRPLAKKTSRTGVR